MLYCMWQFDRPKMLLPVCQFFLQYVMLSFSFWGWHWLSYCLSAIQQYEHCFLFSVWNYNVSSCPVTSYQAYCFRWISLQHLMANDKGNDTASKRLDHCDVFYGAVHIHCRKRFQHCLAAVAQEVKVMLLSIWPPVALLLFRRVKKQESGSIR